MHFVLCIACVCVKVDIMFIDMSAHFLSLDLLVYIGLPDTGTSITLR